MPEIIDNTEKEAVLLSPTPVLIRLDSYEVRECAMTPPKLALLWGMLQRHKTLFSDLTRGDFENWQAYVKDPTTYWLEVYKHGNFVGIVNFTETHQQVDYNAHMVFFDRAPHEKILVCKAIMVYMFANFPIHRLTITPPYMFYALRRLLEKLGFTLEGTKREAILLGNKWVDQMIYGITRPEAERL